jgi:acetylornithine deacetylase/succinyl-diaminopimelate desuccinylase-like protein
VAVALRVVEKLLVRDRLGPGAVAFTVGEEGAGGLRGARAVCDRLEPEAFVALEGHGLDGVVVDAVGSVRARLAVDGPGGHSWRDRGRPSAVHALLVLGGELLRLAKDDAPVNVGLVSGGRSVNTIADHGELVVEGRALEEAKLDAFAAALERLEAPPGLSLAVEPLDRRPSGRLAPEAHLLAVVREVREELGLPDRLEAGSTDANAALAAGIPALGLGVARGSGMHSLAERIDAASLELGARQLEGVLRRLLAASR